MKKFLIPSEELMVKVLQMKTFLAVKEELVRVKSFQLMISTKSNN